jgi:SAM-dependent methyltransferase
MAAPPRPTTVHHPLFARAYAAIADAADRAGVGDHRDELLAGATGRVVEVGAGLGNNFAHYPPTVDEVLAVEPEPYLRHRAEEAAARAPVPVTVVAGVADGLPCEDGWADVAVASLVLCSVADPGAALREMLRVVRPGGELRFYEHVVAHRRGALQGLQRGLDVVWPHVAGGCRLTRDTPAAISAAGWSIESVRRFDFRPSVLAAPVAPHVLGLARRPAAPAEGQAPAG